MECVNASNMKKKDERKEEECEPLVEERRDGGTLPTTNTLESDSGGQNEVEDFSRILSKFRNKNTQSCNIEMKPLLKRIISKKMQFKEVSFFDSLLGDREIAAVVKLLKISPQLEKLDLSYNRFLVHGSRKIANCLSECGVANGKTCSLKTLNLEGNQGIGPTGTAAFMSHIATNTCLTDLNIGSCQACQFGWSFGIKNLAMCLKENKSLKKLNFSNNRISINQFDHYQIFADICDALKQSNIQQVLFSHNNLHERGGTLIANAVAESITITSLALSNCNIEFNAALALSTAIVIRQTSNYPIDTLDLTRNSFFANDDALKAISGAIFTKGQSIRKLLLGGGNGHVDNLNLNLGGGNEYHANDIFNQNTHRFSMSRSLQAENNGLMCLVRNLSFTNEKHSYTEALTLQGIDFHNNEAFKYLCSLLKPIDTLKNAEKSIKQQVQLSKDHALRSKLSRRLLPQNDWDARTALQLKELHLCNTDLQEVELDLLYDAIRVSPFTQHRNCNLEKVFIDRKDFVRIKDDFLKQKLLEKVVIGYEPVRKEVLFAFLGVLNRLEKRMRQETFALPLDLILHIMRYLCSCKYRTVELVGELVEVEEEVDRPARINQDNLVFTEGDGLFTAQRRASAT